MKCAICGGAVPDTERRRARHRDGHEVSCSKRCLGELLHRNRWGGVSEDDRFLGKVDIRSAGECWPWAGSRNPEGYGNFARVIGGRWIQYRAHRYALERTGEIVPKSLLVLHSCDNPSCCNPRHLRVGTNRDNTVDKVSRNRQSRLAGECNPRAKLSEADVREIRRRCENGEKQRDIAASLGVSHGLIGHVRTGRIWGHVS